ncbi:MAG: transporter [Rikenellaceae bacterium]|nr:transporter [Rikenellaceae bacterium]
MNSFIDFLRRWTLPIAMVVGIASYFIFTALPWPDGTYRIAEEAVAFIQPTLLFLMLFLSFCKIRLSDLKFKRWFWLPMLLQVSLFALFAAVLLLMGDHPSRILIESAMLCFLCPTAAAAVVFTVKLGGSAASVTTYTLLINFVVAVLAPLVLPLVHPQEGVSFLPAFWMISSRIFPVLILPLFAAVALEKIWPKMHRICAESKDAAFYLWVCTLTLAIVVTTKSLVHDDSPVGYQLGIALIALICCVGQFWVGRRIGDRYGELVVGGQALGQKNNVFIIWLGYTFLSPITALSGGFFAIWQNVVNAYLLYKKEKQEAKK